MKIEELKKYLAEHPNEKICPGCGGAGERVFPANGKSIECDTCMGGGVVPLKETGNE